MLVSKTISLDVEDLLEIKKSVERGQANNASDFVQKAVRMYLKKVNEGGMFCGIQNKD